MAEATIFALASGGGVAGVAVIRVSGPESNAALQELMVKDRALPPARRASRVDLCDPESKQRLDDALAIRFPEPASFTGEDVVELHVHGGRAVVAAVLDALGRLPGLRPAEAGEFTRRAFDNGRMDLTEVEGLADLINAETEMQRRQALAQLEGCLGRLYESWREVLVGSLAFLEATIDFAEEELPRETAGQAVEAAFALESSVREHLADGRRGEILRDGYRVAIIGAPNAGKSSLLNALARRDVAITSATAGTTSDVIEVHLDIGGFPVLLADTAGIRESEDEIEQEGVRRAVARAEQANMRIAVVDGARPDSWGETLALLRPGDLAVINKCDLGEPGRTVVVDGVEVARISALTGDGLDGLVGLVEARLGVDDGSGGAEAPALTRARHRDALERCADHLARAKAAWVDGRTDELVAEDIRLAARELGRITGRVEVEELLDIVFREFCIGK